MFGRRWRPGYVDTQGIAAHGYEDVTPSRPGRVDDPDGTVVSSAHVEPTDVPKVFTFQH